MPLLLVHLDHVTLYQGLSDSLKFLCSASCSAGDEAPAMELHGCRLLWRCVHVTGDRRVMTFEVTAFGL